MPHVPQLLLSVIVMVQIAVAPVPHAFGVAAAQPHALFVHVCPPGHTVPHAPQLSTSVIVFAQNAVAPVPQ